MVHEIEDIEHKIVVIKGTLTQRHHSLLKESSHLPLGLLERRSDAGLALA